jgi:hypothetical protein
LQSVCEKERSSVSDVFQREIKGCNFVPESIHVLLAINDREPSCGRGSAEYAESSCMSYWKYSSFSKICDVSAFNTKATDENHKFLELGRRGIPTSLGFQRLGVHLYGRFGNSEPLCEESFPLAIAARDRYFSGDLYVLLSPNALR